MPLFKPVKSTMGALTRVRRGGGRPVLPGTTYVNAILGKGLPDPRTELWAPNPSLTRYEMTPVATWSKPQAMR